MTENFFVPLLRISRAHGLKGEVIIHPYHDADALVDYKTLSTAAGQIFTILSCRGQGKYHMIKLKELSDRSAAEAIKGLELGVSRDRLPPVTEQNTWYHTDLMGCSVVDPSGDLIGVITAVHNHGAGDFFDLEGPEGKNICLPLMDEAVLKIDIAQKSITADRRFCLS